MSICLSHGGTTSYFSKGPTEEILVGTLDGAFTIRRIESNHWQIVHKSLAGSHISSLLTDPTTGLTFAGIHKGTICASSDFGKTWEPRDKGISQQDIYCLASVLVEGELRLYAGTEPAHLFESGDLGRNWNEISSLRNVPSVSKWTFPGPPHVAHVKNITFDPKDPRIMYASIEVGGLLKSEDAGATWHELDGFYEDVHRLLIRPSDPKCFYITGGNGIYHSRDQGESWKHLTDRSMRVGYPDPLLIHPKREELMFTGGSINSPSNWRRTHNADPRIARSRDGGRNWEILNEGLPENIRGNIEAMAMDVYNGSFSLFAATTDGEIFCSDDEGDHWCRIIQGLPPISKGGHYRNLR
jgi:photosystem II stability/assembly factor-like uncharacterized protein